VGQKFAVLESSHAESYHHYRLAIVSGGRREQIEWALRSSPIAHLCAVVVSAKDTRPGKPEPQIYQVALERVNGADPAVVPLFRPEECVVTEADGVLRNWGEVSFERLEGLFR